MDLSELIFNTLKNIVDGRVYPNIAPQKVVPTMPFIVYSIVETGRNTTTCNNNSVNAFVQIDLYTLTAEMRLRKDKEIINALKSINAIFSTKRYLFDKDLRAFRASIDFNYLY